MLVILTMYHIAKDIIQRKKEKFHNSPGLNGRNDHIHDESLRQKDDSAKQAPDELRIHWPSSFAQLIFCEKKHVIHHQGSCVTSRRLSMEDNKATLGNSPGTRRRKSMDDVKRAMANLPTGKKLWKKASHDVYIQKLVSGSRSFENLPPTTGTRHTSSKLGKTMPSPRPSQFRNNVTHETEARNDASPRKFYQFIPKAPFSRRYRKSMDRETEVVVFDDTPSTDQVHYVPLLT